MINNIQIIINRVADDVLFKQKYKKNINIAAVLEVWDYKNFAPRY